MRLTFLPAKDSSIIYLVNLNIKFTASCFENSVLHNEIVYYLTIETSINIVYNRSCIIILYSTIDRLTALRPLLYFISIPWQSEHAAIDKGNNSESSISLGVYQISSIFAASIYRQLSLDFVSQHKQTLL